MSSSMKVRNFWKDINEHNWDILTKYFTPNAVIDWPNTGERFSPAEFIRINRESPGDWDISLVRIERTESTVISITLAKERSNGASLYAISFFEFNNSFISQLTEYWSENGDTSEWRKYWQ